MGDSAYSFSLTTFSRTGKLLQIEYALNAVANGRTALGIAASDGVVIATDKKFSSSLVVGDDINKVERITKGSGFVYSGVGPDYRVLGELHIIFYLFYPHMGGICVSYLWDVALEIHNVVVIIGLAFLTSSVLYIVIPNPYIHISLSIKQYAKHENQHRHTIVNTVKPNQSAN
jgi:hypothetical protein